MNEIKAGPLPQHAQAPARDITAPYARLPKPYLARHPRVGYTVFAIALALFLALTGLVMRNSPAVAWDAPAAQAIHAWAAQQSTPVVFAMRFFSAYGRDGVALIAVILMVAWARKGARRELWLLLFGFMGAELWFQVIGKLVNRARPEFKDPFETLIGAGYPSGHAATNVVLGMMVLYLILPYMRRTGVRPLYQALLIAGVTAVVGMILVSRLFLGLHYPTDMIAGTLLGVGWGTLVFTITDTFFWHRR